MRKIGVESMIHVFFCARKYFGNAPTAAVAVPEPGIVRHTKESFVRSRESFVIRKNRSSGAGNRSSCERIVRPEPGIVRHAKESFVTEE
jgi:hypothetical protein